MDKDRGEGKVKEIAGRAQRQAGEGDWRQPNASQGRRQAEGKIQNALGKVKDRVKNASERTGNDVEIEAEDEESNNPRRRAS